MTCRPITARRAIKIARTPLRPGTYRGESVSLNSSGPEHQPRGLGIGKDGPMIFPIATPALYREKMALRISDALRTSSLAYVFFV
jgi:hypothetical protein